MGYEDDRQRELRMPGALRRIAAAVCLAVTVPASVSAFSTHQEPQGSEQERIPAGQVPTEAGVLTDDLADGFPLSIDFVDTDIRDVARFFSSLTGLDVVLDPEITGPANVSFGDVPWDVALSAILRSHQLGYQVDRNIVRVSTLTRMATEATNQALLQQQQELASPLETAVIGLSYAEADALRLIVSAQLSARGEVIVDSRTNSMVVKDTPENLAAVSELVAGLDVAAPQVLIEARIVETTKEFSRELGIQWGFTSVADAQHGNSTGLVFPSDFTVTGNNTTGANQAASTGIGGVPFAVSLPAQAATSGLALTMGNILDTFRLDVALSAMEEEGRGKIISSPKVTAQDNIRASIESGRRIPVQTLVENTASITFINANLQLEVTPQITAEGTVMLDIIVDKSEPDFGNQVNGIPTIFTRRAQTKLLVRDGGTTVIGGIFQMTTTSSEQRVPFFHRIPLIGGLFKSTKSQQENNELLIFLTPRILE